MPGARADRTEEGLVSLGGEEEVDRRERRGGAAWAAGTARVGAGSSLLDWAPGARWLASSLSNVFGPATPLGTLLASKAGAPLVLAGVLGWGGLMSAAALKVASRPVPPPRPTVVLAAPEPPDLVHALEGFGSAGVSLSAASAEGRGAASTELTAEAPVPTALRDAPSGGHAPEAAEPEVAGSETAPEAAPAPERNPPGRSGGASLRQLSPLSGGAGGGAVLAAAGPSLFAPGKRGESRLSAGLGGFALKSSFAGSGGLVGARSSMRGFVRGGGKTRPASGSSQRRAVADNAMGQLRYARAQSLSAAGTTTDARARSNAATAFDATSSIGDTAADLSPASAKLDPPGAASLGPVGSTPGVLPGSPALPGAPGVGPSSNVTPYQDDVDSAKKSGDNAGLLKMLGVALIAAGVGLMALSRALPCPACNAVLAAGVALLMAGIAALAMGASQADQGKQKADEVGRQDGQQEQRDAARNCVDRAYAEGRLVSEICPDGIHPATDPGRARGTSVHEAVEKEMNSTYRMENGPAPGGARPPNDGSGSVSSVTTKP